MQFTKDNLQDIRIDLNEVIKAVADKHGIKLSLGNITFDGAEFVVRLTGKSGAPRDYSQYGLTPLGTIIRMSDGKMMEIIDHDPKSPKNNLIVQEVGKPGAKYKMSNDAAQRLLSLQK